MAQKKLCHCKGLAWLCMYSKTSKDLVRCGVCRTSRGLSLFMTLEMLKSHTMPFVMALWYTTSVELSTTVPPVSGALISCNLAMSSTYRSYKAGSSRVRCWCLCCRMRSSCSRFKIILVDYSDYPTRTRYAVDTKQTVSLDFPSLISVVF